jgi:hypothetical protein
MQMDLKGTAKTPQLIRMVRTVSTKMDFLSVARLLFACSPQLRPANVSVR